MFLEREASIAFVVLRTDSQQHSARSQGECCFLNAEKCLTDAGALAKHDSLEPVIGDDAAPQRVVQIEDQTFVYLATQGSKQARQPLRIQGRETLGEWDFCVMPHRQVEPRVGADEAR